MQYPNQTMVAVCLALACAVAPAQAASQRFDVPAQSLRGVLDALSRQTGVQYFYIEASVSGVDSPGVRGHYAAALGAVLAWRCLPVLRDGQAFGAVALQPFNFFLRGQ
ncbi:hypothetical protein [Rugamonas rubra]|uniref:Uncharacterized protein n=1 Tax=Rugamonas rubra TaxID=758825 RepID=A0A1I4LH20_9BURK|nr:hypothetical protein [Rugamonas rubra]SFL90136.1 hypothetical protein SAMN02982985_01945 [Rugamonas rubra]